MHISMVRGGSALGAAALVIAAAAGCTDDGKDKSAPDTTSQQQSGRSPVHAIQAVAKKTDAAKSAKYDMTMQAPGTTGSIRMTGTMGWDPFAMDATMSGKALSQSADAPDKVKMVMTDGVMYMDVGAKGAKELDGKRWLKLDFAKIAKTAGGEKMADQLTSGLNSQDQNADPAEQMSKLLASKKIKKVGQERIAGVNTTHYAGTVSMESALKSSESTDKLSKADRDKLVREMKKQGVSSYDVDVWVDGKDYPVQIKESFDTKKGPTKMQMRFSDWGTQVTAKAPPAGETQDLMSLLNKMKKQPQS
jgi:hypothetical protein